MQKYVTANFILELCFNMQNKCCKLAQIRNLKYVKICQNKQNVLLEELQECLLVHTCKWCRSTVNRHSHRKLSLRLETWQYYLRSESRATPAPPQQGSARAWSSAHASASGLGRKVAPSRPRTRAEPETAWLALRVKLRLAGTPSQT